MKATNPWYKSAVATAIVGAVFSVIILTLIVLNYVQAKIPEPKREIELENLKIEIQDQPGDEQLLLWIRELDVQSVVDPNRAEELETLKTEIRAGPDDEPRPSEGLDEQLLSRIRQLDLQVKQDEIRRRDLQFRQDKIRRRDFSRKGTYLLLGSVVVFLVGVKLAEAFKKKMPSPQLRGDEPYEQVREAMRARWAVTGGLAILAAGVLFLITGPRIDFTEADVASTSYPSTEQINKNWPGFRGPGGLGISAHTNVPTNWDGKTGEGILWKTKVPLLGFSSPVIWGDRVFLSGGDENKLQVYCFDGLSGKLLWTGHVAAPPRGDEELDIMEDVGFAAPTMVTDGRRVYAIFVTGDVGCFDFSGRKVWNRNLGIPDSAYGYASSLAMYRNLLLIQYDQGMAEDQMSKLIALDAFSGQTVWETKRPVPNSWTSPIVVQIGNQHQIITCGDPWVIAYDPANGAELWRAECLAGEVAPSPIYANGLIFAIEPYTKLVAIRPDGRGNVTETHIAWSIEDGTPDICSPVSNGELIFLLTTEGLLMCYKVADGTKLWEKELEEYFFASPSLVGDLVYLLSEEGLMFIVEAGPEYKELARCELGEECRASLAFADGRIYIRGPENLYCIGKKQRSEIRSQMSESRRQKTDDRR